MGGLVQFPRNRARRGEAERYDPESSSNARRSTRTASETLPITWINATERRDGDEDGDGGGGSAA
jgi:hypothetical protein